MATFNGENFAKSLEFPIVKVEPNELNNQLDCLSEELTLEAELAVGDEIVGPILPEGVKVIDAYITVNGSTGGGGIFELGHKEGFVLGESTSENANLAIGEDSNAFVQAANAGGQPVLERSGPDSVGIFLKPGKGGLQTFIRCTEATDAAIGVRIGWQITYIKR